MLVKEIPYVDLSSKILISWGTLTMADPTIKPYPNNLLRV